MAKIDTDTAEREFDLFCESWDIDNEVEDFSQKEKDEFATLKRRIIRKIKSGNLKMNEDESLTYTLMKPIDGMDNTLTIKRTKGDSRMSMDNYKEDQGIHKGMSKTAAMIGKPLVFISKLDDIDVKVLQALQTIFLAS